MMEVVLDGRLGAAVGGPGLLGEAKGLGEVEEA
jgi:hypothetical protein